MKLKFVIPAPAYAGIDYGKNPWRRTVDTRNKPFKDVQLVIVMSRVLSEAIHKTYGTLAIKYSKLLHSNVRYKHQTNLIFLVFLTG